jgi:hypothetical protein
LAGDEQWRALDSAALEVRADLLLDFENIVEATGSYLEPMHEPKHP